MSDHIKHINHAQEHEQVVQQSKTTPTVICVSHPATPISRAFAKKFETLAENYNRNVKSANDSNNNDNPPIQFCNMEFNGETSMLYKFSPNQLPVVALMCFDRWAKTIMGANIAEVEKAVEEMVERWKELRN